MRKKNMRRTFWMSIGLALMANTSLAADQSVDQAKRIFRRLTGTLLYDNDPRLNQMATAISAGRPEDAAKIASADRHFYDTTLLNWGAPWSSIYGSPGNPLDDMQVTAIGIVRDRLDVRLLLTGAFAYQAKSGLGIPDVVPTNNLHYKNLAVSGIDLSTAIERKDRASTDKIGVFGSRGFAEAYYKAGTNRRAVKFAFKHFLCKDISAWRESGLPEGFIRRDVERKPAGDPVAYQSECRSCHAPMDGMSGAFAKVDFDQDKIILSALVLPKYNQHVDVYPDGYEVRDGSWENYLARNQQSRFGWRGPTNGRSLEEFALMLSQSRAFGECMVRQAVSTVCHNSVGSTERESMIRGLTDELENSSYDMRKIFELISFRDDC
jgi:hypothetical protein